MKLELNITKKHIYYLIGLFVFVFIVGIAMAQTAVNNPGHPAEQIDEGTIAGTLTISNNAVGIGTTSPDDRLDINGTMRIRYGWRGLKIEGTGDGPHRYDFIVGQIGGSASGSDGVIGNYPGEGGFAIWDDTAQAYRFAISRDGNVGIGTTSPAAKLAIYDSVPTQPPLLIDRGYDGARIHFAYAGADTTGAVGMTYYQPGKSTLWMGSNLKGTAASHTGPIQANSGGSSWYSIFESINDYFAINRIAAGGGSITPFYINSAGNVGIGTTSPARKLHVPTGGVILDGLVMGSSIGGGSTVITSETGMGGSGEKIQIKTLAGEGTGITIATSGNVGIGTTNPDYKLHVDTKGNGYIGIDYGTNQYGGIAFRENGIPSGYIQLNDISTTDRLEFFVGGGTDADRKMVIQDNGNVGIGTTNPSFNKFRVSAANNQIGIEDNSGGTDRIWTLNADANQLRITDETAGANRMIIDSTGNVGIGTADPGSYKLKVAGSFYANSVSQGDLYFQKGNEKLWRMFEDENGLYLESLKTGETYKFLLQKIE